jgi:hypothetical protein
MRISAGRMMLVVIAVAACKPRDVAIVDSASTGDMAAAGTFTIADFGQLRWIAGRWRGFMPNGDKFYEEYRFLNDSTIVKYGFPDSTFAKASDSSHVQLRGGTVADESIRSRYVASRLDSAGVDFIPARGAQNSFTWAKESPTTWNATLRWTDRDGKPQTVMYALHKFGR